MGWNEPPGGENGKDPWGNQGGKRGNQGGKRNEGPPDLDQLLQKMQQGFSNILTGKAAENGNNNPSKLVWLGIVVALLVWLSTGFYVIDEQEKAIVLRFGAHIDTLSPGLRLRFPRPIERVIKVNVAQTRTFTHQASMLTKDANIVDVEVAVQWRVKNPHDFIFNVVEASMTLRQVSESAIREVIGTNTLDDIISRGRRDIQIQQKALIQEIIDRYHAGILITDVNMRGANPPKAVADAFDDANKAGEDENKYINQAEAYENDIIPKARGAAARLIEEANGYKARVVAKAEGEASRFEQLFFEYEKAPGVTRQRLYLDTIESVFSNSSKVFMDSESGNSLMYLPLDKLMRQLPDQSSLRGQGAPSTSTENQSNREAGSRINTTLDRNRSRGVR